MNIEQILETAYLSVSTVTIKAAVDVDKFEALLNPPVKETDVDVFEMEYGWYQKQGAPDFVISIDKFQGNLSIYCAYPFSLIELDKFLKQYIQTNQ